MNPIKGNRLRGSHPTSIKINPNAQREREVPRQTKSTAKGFVAASAAAAPEEAMARMVRLLTGLAGSSSECRTASLEKKIAGPGLPPLLVVATERRLVEEGRKQRTGAFKRPATLLHAATLISLSPSHLPLSPHLQKHPDAANILDLPFAGS